MSQQNSITKSISNSITNGKARMNAWSFQRWVDKGVRKGWMTLGTGVVGNLKIAARACQNAFAALPTPAKAIIGLGGVYLVGAAIQARLKLHVLQVEYEGQSVSTPMGSGRCERYGREADNDGLLAQVNIGGQLLYVPIQNVELGGNRRQDESLEAAAN
jgi:hypothetical protein